MPPAPFSFDHSGAGLDLVCKGANRSEHFARRLTLDLLGLFLISLPLTLGYWRIDQAAGSAVLSNLAIVVLYLTLYLLTAAMLKRCFQLSCRSCLMAAATGYVCQHIFYEIRLIVNAFLKLDVALYAAVGWHAGFWVSFFWSLPWLKASCSFSTASSGSVQQRSAWMMPAVPT